MKRFIDFFEKKCAQLFPNYQPVDLKVISDYSTFNDTEIVSAASATLNLILLEKNDPNLLQIIKKCYDYLKISVIINEAHNKFPLSTIETSLMSLISNAVCFNKNMSDISLVNEMTDFCFRKISNLIE